jgi:hypothetical protein
LHCQQPQSVGWEHAPPGDVPPGFGSEEVDAVHAASTIANEELAKAARATKAIREGKDGRKAGER